MFELAVIALLVLIVLGLLAVYSMTSRGLSLVNDQLNELRQNYLKELERQKKERKASAWSDFLKEMKRRFEEDMDRSLKEGSLKREETMEGETVVSGEVVCGVCGKAYSFLTGAVTGCPHCWEDYEKDVLRRMD